MTKGGIEYEGGTCSSKEDRRVAVNFDWHVWMSIFKPEEADIVSILFIYLDSHEGFLYVSKKAYLCALKRWTMVLSDLNRQGPVYRQSVTHDLHWLRRQLEEVSSHCQGAERRSG